MSGWKFSLNIPFLGHVCGTGIDQQALHMYVAAPIYGVNLDFICMQFFCAKSLRLYVALGSITRDFIIEVEAQDAMSDDDVHQAEDIVGVSELNLTDHGEEKLVHRTVVRSSRKQAGEDNGELAERLVMRPPWLKSVTKLVSQLVDSLSSHCLCQPAHLTVFRAFRATYLPELPPTLLAHRTS